MCKCEDSYCETCNPKFAKDMKTLDEMGGEWGTGPDGRKGWWLYESAKPQYLGITLQVAIETLDLAPWRNMQTITTKYLGPTDTLGSRISATATGGQRIVVSRDYGLNTYNNHAAAMVALCRKLNWKGKLQGGDTKTGTVWIFVDVFNQIEVGRGEGE